MCVCVCVPVHVCDCVCVCVCVCVNSPPMTLHVGEGYDWAIISGGQPKIPSGPAEDGKCKTGDGVNDSGLWLVGGERSKQHGLRFTHSLTPRVVSRLNSSPPARFFFHLCSPSPSQHVTACAYVVIVGRRRGKKKTFMIPPHR